MRAVLAVVASAVLRALGQREHPPLEFTDEKVAAFSALAKEFVDTGGNAWLPDDLPWPKYEFLAWLRAERDVLFHGTRRDDLDVLSPVRLSRDSAAFGDQRAVYASDDPIWAMYFAVLRKGVVTWTRNSCIRVLGGGRERLPRYAFAVNRGALTPQTFGPGVVYILPPETFRADKLEMGVLDTCHWVSDGEVVPLARIRVGPSDFPFLQDVFEADRTGELRFALAHWRSRRR